MPTRVAIRQAAAFRADGNYLASTASGGNTTTLVDAPRLRRDSYSPDFYEGFWIYFTGGDLLADNNTRQVEDAGYAPSTGTLTQDGAAWSASCDSGDTYELHQLMDPRDWNLCIDEALLSATKYRDEAITIVTSQKQYSLSSVASYLERKEEIVDVYLRYGATADQYTYCSLPARAWDVIEDDDAFTLDLKSALTNSTQLALFIKCIGPYAVLATDATTTTCPKKWAVALTLQRFFERYKAMGGEFTKRLSDLKDEIDDEAMNLSSILRPEVGRALRLNI